MSVEDSYLDRVIYALAIELSWEPACSTWLNLNPALCVPRTFAQRVRLVGETSNVVQDVWLGLGTFGGNVLSNCRLVVSILVKYQKLRYEFVELVVVVTQKRGRRLEEDCIFIWSNTDGEIPWDVFVCMQITHSQELPMLFYKFIYTQVLTLNLQNIAKCSLHK